jgi:hypothetical protein
MWEEDAGVVTARWESEAAIGMIGAVRDGVGAFADGQGMAHAAREDVRAAVCEAVADAVVRLRRSETPGRVVVGVATDGVWLSVQVKDNAAVHSRGPDESLPLVACLPQRLEWAADAAGTQLLMEFAMTPGVAAAPAVATQAAVPVSAFAPSCRRPDLRLVARRRP